MIPEADGPLQKHGRIDIKVDYKVTGSDNVNWIQLT
jgi:hypothetical protein